jgi:hypothetical protein
METVTTNNTRASITAEWHDHRLGMTAFGAMVQILKAAGATDITAPSMDWLTFVPCEEGFEGELSFTFAHNLSWRLGETAPVTKALREVVRVKALNWDLDYEDEDEDED